MADICSDDLQLSETKLLADDESYMGELSEDELGLVAGGSTPVALLISAAGVSGFVGSITGSKQIVDWIQGDD